MSLDLDAIRQAYEHGVVGSGSHDVTGVSKDDLIAHIPDLIVEIEKHRTRESALRELAMQDRARMEAEVERLRGREVAWHEMEAKYAEALNDLAQLRAWLRTWVIRLSPGAMEHMGAALACECEEPMDLEAFLESTNPVVHREGCPVAALDVASGQEVVHD